MGAIAILTMTTTVKQWNNNLAIQIPQHFAQKIKIDEGTQVDIEIADGTLVIHPRRRKRYSLDELVQGITPENRHNEMRL